MKTFRSYTSRDRDWVRQANLTFYQSVHGFDASFSEALERALDHLEAQLAESTSTYLIVETSTGPVGSIFLSSEDDITARIRLFFLTEPYRGKGVGARMLLHVLEAARQTGFESICVSTFDRHPEAVSLYEKAGFHVSKKTPTRAFGQRMHQLDLELLLL